MNNGKKMTRRSFLKLMGAAGLDLFLLAIGGGLYSFLVEPSRIQVETVSLKLPRLARVFSGLRVVQISDIHMGGWMNRERFQHVADLIRVQNPDLLLITGDFLIGHGFSEVAQQSLQDVIDVLLPLAKAISTFAVLGNHDYWTNAKAIRRMLTTCGITNLTNSVFSLARDGRNLHLCGVDDIWAGDVQLQDVTAQLTDDDAAILLAHEPDFADSSAATDKFDLQVSGHSHGGQVVIPFYGPPILPYLGQNYPSGLYHVGNMFQYTNRGVGMHRLAIRFNCPPEITVFVLEGES
jgi:predicted MPP superfamily phosphohydrolase